MQSEERTTLVNIKRYLPAAILLSLAMPAQAAADTGGEAWDWYVAPYLWMPSVGVDLNRNMPPFGNETAFDDIISKIDMALFVHAEGQGDRFGVFGDFIYFSLSDDKTRQVYSSEASLDATVIEVAGVWNVSPERYDGLDLFAGLRYFDVELGLQLDPVNPSFATVDLGTDDSFADAMIGARYNAKLSDRWGVALRGDGSWGDTDGSYSASAMFNYKMGNGAWLFGYRYLEVELPTTAQSVTIDLSGPVVGYAFSF